jgi:CheY-like chemotaxis protein
LGFASFLMQDLPKGSPEHGFAERIGTAGERGKDLVRQILAFSRQGIIERKAADLGALVEEARDLLIASVPGSTRLEVTVAEKGLIADVNSAQVSQVLLNLCLNANDALMGEPGEITITLSRLDPSDPDLVPVPGASAAAAAGSEAARRASDVAHIAFGAIRAGKAYAHIAVADTGTGMSHEVLQHVFDPFYTTKGRGRGTGLGLAVVHGVVTAHDGALMVTSHLGSGSVFDVYLPLCSAPADSRAQEARIVSLHGRERVLVVDDEPAVADVLTLGLERLGYEVVALNDPEEAIAAFAENPDAWDVVISDQVMRKMRGLTLLARLKGIRSSIRFILCTGFSEEITAESAAAAGASAFFLKPASIEDIATAIRRFFDRPAA